MKILDMWTHGNKAWAKVQYKTGWFRKETRNAVCLLNWKGEAPSYEWRWHDTGRDVDYADSHELEAEYGARKFLKRRDAWMEKQ